MKIAHFFLFSGLNFFAAWNQNENNISNVELFEPCLKGSTLTRFEKCKPLSSFLLYSEGQMPILVQI